MEGPGNGLERRRARGKSVIEKVRFVCCSEAVDHDDDDDDGDAGSTMQDREEKGRKRGRRREDMGRKGEAEDAKGGKQRGWEG